MQSPSPQLSAQQFRANSTLMVQGCTSDAGKSVMVAGLCRLLHNKGIYVAPFKPQNMALNSAVTKDGGEIGRAQALQAIAAAIEPRVDFNPILLKPNSDTGAQVIIQGKAISNMQAQAYHDYKKVAKQAVLDSYQRLNNEFTNIIVEGAGSPAEINLRQGDIANMGFAEAVDCPVVLVADIDRGGVFAHLVGTLELLSKSERNRVVGFIINRFRGDIKLLEPGLEWLEQRTGIPVVGVIPYLHNLFLDAEDAINVSQPTQSDALKVIVPVLPRISNHTDFDALRLHPNVDLQFITPDSSERAADLIILPGSKNVINDLQCLYDNGWGESLNKHLRYGGKVLGICGGYQMLGQSISDPSGIESDGRANHINGLGLLNSNTSLEADKQLKNVTGLLKLDDQPAVVTVTGYEIHCGQSQHQTDSKPPFTFDDGRSDGCINADNNVLGTYLHGLFDNPEACNALLNWAGLSQRGAVDLEQIREQQLNRLADTLEQHLKPEFLETLYASSANSEANVR